MIVCYAEGMEDPKFRAGYIYALKQQGKLEEYIEAQYQEAEVLRKVIEDQGERLMEWSKNMMSVSGRAPCAHCRMSVTIIEELDYFNPEYHFCSDECRLEHEHNGEEGE